MNSDTVPSADPDGGCRTNLIHRFSEDRSGAVAVLFGLMAIVMFLFIGAAVDYGRWLNARSSTIAAVDAAVLAAGRSLQVAPLDTAGALAAANKYYKENTKDRVPLQSDTIAFKLGDANTSVTASGTARINTPFLSLAGIKTLPLLKVAGTEFSKAQLAVGGNGENNLEIAMMLDITGSMCNSAPSSNRAPCSSARKLDAMKAAAKDLVNIVVWADQSQYKSRVAIIPFADGVRLPSALNTLVRGTPVASKVLTYTSGKKTLGMTYLSTPCVVERAGTNKFTDVAPGAGNYVMTMYTTDGACSLGTYAEVQPLTSDKTVLEAKINGLKGKNGTAGQLGTAWAWYALAPNFNSVWTGTANDAAAYGSDKLKKIAILMTDGEYNTEYDSNGVNVDSTGAGNAANGSSESQARSLCTNMKAKGITVYTVGFEVGNNQTAISTLSACATDTGKFFNAQNDSELKNAFREIALQVSDLFLSQ